jgi:enoyl-CoA hydratase/carnithine racemase
VGLSSATADVSGVVTFTFDDPATRNSLSLSDLSALLDGLYVLGPECRAVVFTGGGDAFSSGANRTQMADPANIERATVLVHRLLDRLDALEVPVVARVNGLAFGAALALAVAADVAIADEDARFGFPEVRFGMVAEPAIAACRRRVSEGVLRDLFLTGRQFTGAEAAAVGLVNRAVPAAELDAAVNDVLTDLISGDPKAIAATRRLLRG